VISRLELASKSITVQELVSKTEEYYRSIACGANFAGYMVFLNGIIALALV
jgi:hypothetical protein